MTDKILRELRSIKDSIADECGRDLRRLFDKLKLAEKVTNRPVVNRTGHRKHVPASR
jgi:hypothetical protein